MSCRYAARYSNFTSVVLQQNKPIRRLLRRYTNPTNHFVSRNNNKWLTSEKTRPTVVAMTAEQLTPRQTGCSRVITTT